MSITTRVTYTVIYDGDCRVCTRFADELRSRDRYRILDVVSSQQAGVVQQFPWIPEGAFVDALQLVAADGTTWQGAAAIEQLLHVLPKGRLFVWIFRVPFIRPLADHLYRWFARARYRFGCNSHCQSRPLNSVRGESENRG